MPAKPPAIPSALSRRDAARHRLAGALDCRDAQAVLTFTGQWVHRQGMASLEPLMAELAGGEALHWWQALLQQPIDTVGLGPAHANAGSQAIPANAPLAALTATLKPGPIRSQEPERSTAGEQDADRRASQADLLAPLNAGGPAAGTVKVAGEIGTTGSSDAESRETAIRETAIREAEITNTEFTTTAFTTAELISPEFKFSTEASKIEREWYQSEAIEFQASTVKTRPTAESELLEAQLPEVDHPGLGIQSEGIQSPVIQSLGTHGDAESEPPAPIPTVAETPTPPAGPAFVTMPPAARPAVAQVRRGPGSNRPAPAPRNPELARLRAWLPVSDGQAGPSNRSHAA